MRYSGNMLRDLVPAYMNRERALSGETRYCGQSTVVKLTSHERQRTSRVRWEFSEQLDRWGPGVESREVSPEQARAYCRSVAGTHYENFPVVSWLLPRGLRVHFRCVYAYCRWADDLADEVVDAGQSLELLSWWRDELHACYAGRRRHPVFVALGETIEQFAIPIEPFEDLIGAFEQDQRVFAYQTYEELEDYCRRSANPVGRLVLCLCECASAENVAWSDSICTGLQLANFWQDVSRDFDLGRVYLPVEDCQRFGYGPEDLQQRVTNEAFLELMRFEVERARGALSTGRPLVDAVPGRLRVDIDLFVGGGLKILERIERIGYRVWETRPTVTKTDGVKLLLGSVGRAALRALSRNRGRSARERAGEGGA